VVGSLILLGVNSMISLLMILVGYGGLILIRFLIVAPNGVHRIFLGTLLVVFGVTIFGSFNVILIFILLLILIYIL
jgi:hypothetical protein